MTKNRIIKGSMVIVITLLFIAMSISTAQLKGNSLNESNVQLAEAEYTGSRYFEQIDIHPLKDTAIGAHVGFFGGTVELPFDVTSYDNLEALNFIVANQISWREYSQRRFWDIGDGATLSLTFQGLTTSECLTQGNAIASMIETSYNLSFTLIYGKWNGYDGVSTLVYQSIISESYLDSFTDVYASYISDEGFGEGITTSVLNEAPVKAMAITLIKAKFLDAMHIDLGLVPVLQCAWVNPDGLEKDGTIMDFSLLNTMPDLTSITGASNAWASLVRLNLPYIVDMLDVNPITNQPYNENRGIYFWLVKFIDFGIDFNYEDIFVSYDLNLSDKRSYPQVIGELSLNSSLPINGSQDIEYVFTWENVDAVETAYNITLSYGDFAYEELTGYSAPVENQELNFDENKIIYYNLTDGYISDTMITGSDIYTIEGWFFNGTSGTWLGAGEYHPDEGIDDLIDLAHVDQTFLQLDNGDFDVTNITGVPDHFTLTTIIDELAPGENVTKSFAVRDIPTGTFNYYNYDDGITTNATIFIQEQVDWEEYFTLMLRMGGSTLHIPEDQVTWTNLFPQDVVGSPFVYYEEDGTEFMGLTNGLVIQLYDDEAVLVGKVSLDKDVYQFGDNLTFTLELENIGNADAIDIDYRFYQALITSDLELEEIHLVQDSYGTFPLVKAGETVSIEFTFTAQGYFGLQPVFAVFGYTSNETGTDPRDVYQPLPEFLTRGMSNESIAEIETLIYSHPIFNTTRHKYVISSMDFGFVLPPPGKDGSTDPLYPTPEVEVTTELIGLTNNTKVGDEITLRTTITNIGNEPTNIIYIQRIPGNLGFVADTDSVAVEGVEVSSYVKDWINPQIGMTVGRIARFYNSNEAVGITLGVNETMVIEVNLLVKDSGEIYIPSAEIRYNSKYNMTSRNGINDDSTAPTNETGESMLGVLYTTSESSDIIRDLSMNDFSSSSTNSWGSYSNSLSFSIQSFGDNNLGWLNFIYIGVGLIAITGVAVLIYFRANGKKH